MAFELTNFNHYQPSRLLVLTHPAWTVRTDISPLLPLWQQYLEDAKTDNQVAILIIDCVTRSIDNSDVSNKVKSNMQTYTLWFDKLKQDYKNKIAIWATRGQNAKTHRGLLRPDLEQVHFDWLHKELNLAPNTIELPFPIFGKTHSSFYQIDYHGIGMDSCVWTQMNHLRKLTYIEQEWNLQKYNDKLLSKYIND